MCVRRHTTVACTDTVHYSVFSHVYFVFLIFLLAQIKQMYIDSIRHHSLLHKKMLLTATCPHCGKICSEAAGPHQELGCHMLSTLALIFVVTPAISTFAIVIRATLFGA